MRNITIYILFVESNSIFPYGGIWKPHGCDTWRQRLVMALAVPGKWFDLMVWEGFFQSKCFFDPTVLCTAAVYEMCTFSATTNCSPYSKGRVAVWVHLAEIKTPAEQSLPDNNSARLMYSVHVCILSVLHLQLQVVFVCHSPLSM